MYTAIAGIPGRRQTIQNTIPLPHHRLMQHNHQPIKARAAVRIQNPVADRRLPARCPALPAIGPGAAPAQVAGVAAEAEEVLVAEGEVEDLAEVAEVAEEVLAVVEVVDGVEDNFRGF